MDLVREYNLWESGSQAFSFCQYPFVLGLPAKRLIMQKDSETKMLLEARQSLVNKFRQKQMPNMGMLFLNLQIRRKHLLTDSLKEISKNQADLKKKLRVVFTGEPGIDLGELGNKFDVFVFISFIFLPFLNFVLSAYWNEFLTKIGSQRKQILILQMHNQNNNSNMHFYQINFLGTNSCFVTNLSHQLLCKIFFEL